MLALPNLLQTAIRLETAPDDKQRPNVFAYHSLLRAFRNKDKVWRVLLYVRHTHNGCVSWGGAPKGRVDRTTRRKTAQGVVTPAATSRPTVVEIAELIRTVKYDDKETFVALTQSSETREMRAAPAEAQTADIFLVQTEGYPRWREDAEGLHAAGTAILADPDLELHLEEIPLGRALTRDAIERFERYRSGDSEIEAHIAAAPKKADWSWETAREGMRFDEQPTARPEASVSLHM